MAMSDHPDFEKIRAICMLIMFAIMAFRLAAPLVRLFKRCFGKLIITILSNIFTNTYIIYNKKIICPSSYFIVKN